MAIFQRFDPRKQINLVIAQMNAGDYLGALKVCEKVMQRLPRHPEGARLMGQIYERLGNDHKAAALYRIALDERPISPNFVAYGHACQRLGERVEATLVFERGLKVAPESVEIMTALSEIYEERKLWPKAVGMRKAISDRDPDNLDALFNLAHCTYLAHLLDETVILCTRLLNRDPDHPYGLRLLADCMLYRKHHERALELYERALKVKPDDWDGHFQMAEIYLTIGERESAIRHFQLCIRHKNEHKDAHERLIELYTQDREWLEAKIVIQHRLAIGDTSLKLLIDLGDVCQKLGEYEEAATAYQNARNIGRSDRDLDARYVTAAIHAGRAKDVLNLTHELASEDQLNIRHQHLYALALLAVGEQEKAAEVLKGIPASETANPEFVALQERFLKEAPSSGTEGTQA
jgi:tetratricopeptide (TPR) repeat protein